MLLLVRIRCQKLEFTWTVFAINVRSVTRISRNKLGVYMHQTNTNPYKKLSHITCGRTIHIKGKPFQTKLIPNDQKNAGSKVHLKMIWKCLVAEVVNK